MKTTKELERPVGFGPWETLKGYVEIARVDHWFKNVFLVIALVFALFHQPDAVSWQLFPHILGAMVAICLMASSNYVLNEIQDATFDRFHPEKQHRPFPSGKVKASFAYVEWGLLLVAGLAVAASINLPFFYTSLAFLVMGWCYNINPVRLKEIPFGDVIAESANNPLRFLLGWFVVIPDFFPPVSLLIAYWAIGAFFMGTKRLAEYRHINDKGRAIRYRKSFKYYDESILLVSSTVYLSVFYFFLGLFVVKYHLEVVFSIPVMMVFTGYYLKLSLQENGVTQRPEHLYKEKRLVLLGCLTMGLGICLLFVDLPGLYELLHVNIAPLQVAPLWKF